MWVAKAKIDNIELPSELSPRFKSIYDCQKYIDDNLKKAESILDSYQSFIDYEVNKTLVIRFGSYIRCYNVEQERFCTGFDF